MSFEIGQRLGRLTVTQLEHGSVAVRVRCDCSTTIAVRLEFSFHTPPDEIGHYHAPYLLMAEDGQLRYNRRDYPIHAVPNNAIDALWRGLLVDAPDGPVLTELGAHMLAHWKESHPGGEPAAAGPPPFTDKRAAWIRANVWTTPMRKTYRETRYPSSCACEATLTAHCEAGRCEQCTGGFALRACETYICGHGGARVLAFPEPYQHESDVSATGPRFEDVAMVWLADRVCRAICPHPCHTAPSAPSAPAAAVQDALFPIGATT